MTGYRPPNQQVLKREFEKLEKPVKITLLFSTQKDPNSPEILEFLRFISDQDSRIGLI